MRFCPRCGSKNIDWVLPQIWSKYECKDCGYIGVFIITDFCQGFIGRGEIIFSIDLLKNWN